MVPSTKGRRMKRPTFEDYPDHVLFEEANKQYIDWLELYISWQENSLFSHQLSLSADLDFLASLRKSFL